VCRILASGCGFQVLEILGLRVRVQGLWFRIQGTGYRVQDL